MRTFTKESSRYFPVLSARFFRLSTNSVDEGELKTRERALSPTTCCSTPCQSNVLGQLRQPQPRGRLGAGSIAAVPGARLGAASCGSAPGGWSPGSWAGGGGGGGSPLPGGRGRTGRPRSAPFRPAPRPAARGLGLPGCPVRGGAWAVGLFIYLFASSSFFFLWLFSRRSPT